MYDIDVIYSVGLDEYNVSDVPGDRPASTVWYFVSQDSAICSMIAILEGKHGSK